MRNLDWFQVVETRGTIGPTGVEQDAAMVLGYDDGRWALVDCSLRMPLAGAASVIGTAGRPGPRGSDRPVGCRR